MIKNHFISLKRFSLRSLFVLMTLCCVVFGLWAVYVNPYRLQLRSLAAVNRLKGESLVKTAEGSGWHRWLVTTTLGDNSFVNVTAVNLAGRNAGDDAIRSLTGLVHLEELALDYTPITDEGLAALRSMPNLDRLSLRFTNVSDRGVDYLLALPNLHRVMLMGTKVSDDAIPKLSKLQGMSELYIRWTGISNDGAERLRTALPNCAVYHHALQP
jgi:hypothetical protein